MGWVTRGRRMGWGPMAPTPLALPGVPGSSPGHGRQPDCSGGLWRNQVDAGVLGDRAADPAGRSEDPVRVLVGHFCGEPAGEGVLKLHRELLPDGCL